MALSVTGFDDSSLSYKIIYESVSTHAPVKNATGTSGYIHSIEINNAHSSPIYVRMWLNTTDITLTNGGQSNTAADITYKVPATTTDIIQIPSRLYYTALSFASTAASGLTAVATPGGTVQVTIVSS